MTVSISDTGISFADTSVAPQQFSIGASVAINALTITLNPSTVSFRSSTLGQGGVITLQNAAAISLIVPSGATLGSANAIQNQLLLLAINNAGTIELAVVNIAGGNDLSESSLISTVAITSAALTNNVIYSNTARTNVTYRVIGTIVSTQAIAGTWATAPSLVQGYGGRAAVAASGAISDVVTQNTNVTLAIGVNDGKLTQTTSGNPVYTFPTAVGNKGKTIVLYNSTSSDTGLRIVCNGAESIGGAIGTTIYQPGYTTIGYVSDGTNWIVFYYTGKRHFQFSSSSTWYCPPGIYSVACDGAGGGGGGGGGDGITGGTTGGGGARVIGSTLAVVPGTAYTITVGAGGGGGGSNANGSAGGATSFGILLSLPGGGGGGASGASPGLGGVPGGTWGGTILANTFDVSASPNTGFGSNGVISFPGFSGGSGFLVVRI